MILSTALWVGVTSSCSRRINWGSENLDNLKPHNWYWELCIDPIPEWFPHPCSFCWNTEWWAGLSSRTINAFSLPLKSFLWWKVKSLSHVWLFATPWTVAYHAPPSLGLSRQEYWSGLPFPSPEIFPTQGSNPGLPHCRQTLYRLSHQGSPSKRIIWILLLWITGLQNRAGQWKACSLHIITG